jgi:hypothetical protein
LRNDDRLPGFYGADRFGGHKSAQAFDDEGAHLILEVETVFDSVKAPSKLTEAGLR